MAVGVTEGLRVVVVVRVPVSVPLEERVGVLEQVWEAVGVRVGVQLDEAGTGHHPPCTFPPVRPLLPEACPSTKR